MTTLEVRSKAREELIDITAEVRAAVRASDVDSGLCVVFCPHTTAAVTIQENADPDVRHDLVGHLRKLVPEGAAFRHAEGNSDAHIKASLIGSSATLIVEGGAPFLGRWQAIFLCELDGPRAREVRVQVVGGA